MLIFDAARESKEVGVELHAVSMPHRKLELLMSRSCSSIPWRPSPALEGVQEVQLLLESTSEQPVWWAFEVAINVIGVVFVFAKRAVDEDPCDADGR